MCFRRSVQTVIGEIAIWSRFLVEVGGAYEI